MAIRDPQPLQATGDLLVGNGMSGTVHLGKIDASKIAWGEGHDPDIDKAAVMTRVAHELSVSLGISAKEAMDSLAAASAIVASTVRPAVPAANHRLELDLDEYALLQRVAAMAGQMLGPMRAAGLSDSEYARFTALRNALVALQIYDGATMPSSPLGSDEVVNDLADLLSDLAEPAPASGNP